MAEHVDPSAVQRLVDRLQPGPAVPDVEDALREICRAAEELLGVDGSGVLLVDEGRVQRSTVATDDAGRQLEAHQEALGEGPCVDALMHGHVVATSDVRTDERWPRLAKVLDAPELHAVLGAPIHVGGQTVGSINVYRGETYEWDDSDMSALSRLSNVAGQILSTALLASSQEKVVRQLQVALENRVVIERAVGMLMGRHDLDAVDAFERLRQRARADRRKVVDIATEVLEGIRPDA